MAGMLALAGGGVGGWLLGGPGGLVALGLGALAVAAPLVDRLAASRRPLTTADIDYARAVYADSLDYGRVSLTRDSVFALGAPRTIMNTVNLKSGWGHFLGDSCDLSEFGREILIHELGHAWQFQNGGLAYIPKSLWAQLTAWLIRHTRDAAYEWRPAAEGGLPWERWNPEQQAEAMADYKRALLRLASPSGTADDQALLDLLLPFVLRVRRREGAPTFG